MEIRDAAQATCFDDCFSIALVTYQVVEINDVAAGLLYYVAQSFLLAGSIFGLDQYIRIIKKSSHERESQ